MSDKIRRRCSLCGSDTVVDEPEHTCWECGNCRAVLLYQGSAPAEVIVASAQGTCRVYIGPRTTGPGDAIHVEHCPCGERHEIARAVGCWRKE